MRDCQAIEVDNTREFTKFNNHKCILTPDDVRKIHELYFSDGFTQKVIAKMYGVNEITICKAINKRTWAWVE